MQIFLETPVITPRFALRVLFPIVQKYSSRPFEGRRCWFGTSASSRNRKVPTRNSSVDDLSTLSLVFSIENSQAEPAHQLEVVQVVNRGTPSFYSKHRTARPYIHEISHKILCSQEGPQLRDYAASCNLFPVLPPPKYVYSRDQRGKIRGTCSRDVVTDTGHRQLQKEKEEAYSNGGAGGSDVYGEAGENKERRSRETDSKRASTNNEC